MTLRLPRFHFLLLVAFTTRGWWPRDADKDRGWGWGWVLGQPHLINGMKYDMRIYVLVVSCDPLRVFIYEEGLVRFCTEPYTAPSEHNLVRATRRNALCRPQPPRLQEEAHSRIYFFVYHPSARERR